MLTVPLTTRMKHKNATTNRSLRVVGRIIILTSSAAILHVVSGDDAGADGADESAEESTFYYPQSWPIVQFITAFILAATFLLAAFFITSVVVAAPHPLSSFNVYLIFIIVPDCLLNGIVAISLFWEVTHEGIYASELCKARTSLSFFHYIANLYLNAVVVRQIDILVKNSYRRQRTIPPPLNKVFRQIAMVYFLSALLVAWFLADVRWSPIAITDEVYCVTSTGSPTTSTNDNDTDPGVFTMATGNAVAVGVALPPFVYVFWVAYKIWKGHLLPIKGRTRALSIYFFRIVISFFAFYAPSLSLATAYMNIDEDKFTASFWVVWVFNLLIPLQCLITLRLALTKTDIRQALRSNASRLSGFFNIMSSNAAVANHSTGSSYYEDQDDWDAEDEYDGEAPSATFSTTTNSTNLFKQEEQQSPNLHGSSASCCCCCCCKEGVANDTTADKLEEDSDKNTITIPQGGLTSGIQQHDQCGCSS